MWGASVWEESELAALYFPLSLNDIPMISTDSHAFPAFFRWATYILLLSLLAFLFWKKNNLHLQSIDYNSWQMYANAKMVKQSCTNIFIRECDVLKGGSASVALKIQSQQSSPTASSLLILLGDRSLPTFPIFYPQLHKHHWKRHRCVDTHKRGIKQ